MAELANMAKKVLLSAGIMLFALLCAMFLSIAGNYADYDLFTWLLAVFFAFGPALVCAVMGMALMERKSKKLLIALGVWFALFILLFIIMIIETAYYGS